MSTPFLVKDIYPGSFGSYLGFVTALGNTLFFWANDGVNGYGLWKSDGTTAGTVLVADISFGDSFPGNPKGKRSSPSTLLSTSSTLKGGLAIT